MNKLAYMFCSLFLLSSSIQANEDPVELFIKNKKLAKAEEALLMDRKIQSDLLADIHEAQRKIYDSGMVYDSNTKGYVYKAKPQISRGGGRGGQSYQTEKPIVMSTTPPVSVTSTHKGVVFEDSADDIPQAPLVKPPQLIGIIGMTEAIFVIDGVSVHVEEGELLATGHIVEKIGRGKVTLMDSSNRKQVVRNSWKGYSEPQSITQEESPNTAPMF